MDEILTKRQRFICNEFHVNGLSKREIGDLLGYSRERVRQIIREYCPVAPKVNLEEKEWLSVKEAATRAGLTEGVIKGLIKRGELYAVQSHVRIRVNGSSLTAYLDTPKSDPALERFTSRVEVGPDCWLWTGCRTNLGYGRVRWHGREIYAHRVAYELCIGPIPDGLFVCHHCDNPPCVRPDHLFVGTASENTLDSVAKGRWGPQVHPEAYRGSKARRGANSPFALFTIEQVREIRALAATKTVTQRSIAEARGVSEDTISKIVLNKRYVEEG